MNLKKLLLNPTTNANDTGQESLSLEAVEFLIDKKIFSEEFFLETHDGNPIWALWVANGCKTDITNKLNFVVQRLSYKNGFSWAALYTDDPPNSRVESCLGRFAFSLSLSDFEQALQSLSIEQYKQLVEDPKGYSNILLKSFNKGCLNYADICLKNGWDINEKNSLGQTIVFQARDWETAKEMVKRGSRLNVRDTEGRFVSDNISVWGHKNKSIFSEFLQLSANEPSDTSMPSPPTQTNSNTTVSQEAVHLISGMVGDLSRHRMGEFATLIKKLNKIPNNNQEFINPISGKPICEMVCDGLKKKRYGSLRGQDSTLFLLRFCNNLFPNSVENGWIDVNRPVTNFPQWTVRDHLLMTLSIQLLDGGKSLSKIPEKFQNTLSSWLKTTHLLPDMDVWLKTFDSPNNLLKGLKLGATSVVMEREIIDSLTKTMSNLDVFKTVFSDLSKEIEHIEKEKRNGNFVYANCIATMRQSNYEFDNINYGVWSVLCHALAAYPSPELEKLIVPVSLIMISHHLIQRSELGTYGYTKQMAINEFLKNDFFRLLKQDPSALQWLEELNGTWADAPEERSLSQLLCKRERLDQDFFEQCLTIRQQLVLTSSLNSDETRKSACRRKM